MGTCSQVSEHAVMAASKNEELCRGVNRYSRSAMYAKRFGWKYKKGSTTKIEKKHKPSMKEKVIGGDKNGEKRMVPVKRFPKYYPTESPRRKLTSRGKKPFSAHTRKLRSTITPGTVLIPLVGAHKGKHVIFLKQLDSGLLLVTGPHKINGCPLRRMNQVYVIATKTKVDISSVNVPEKLNDAYFKRKKLNKPKHGDSEIFDTEEEATQLQLNVKRIKKLLIANFLQLLKALNSWKGTCPASLDCKMDNIPTTWYFKNSGTMNQIVIPF